MMGLLIVVAAVGAIVGLTIVARTECADPDMRFVAYVPGVTELRADTRVQLFDQCVGRVASVEPGLPALQLSISRPGSLGDREALTLSQRDPVATVDGEDLTIRFESIASVGIESAGSGAWTIAAQGDGFWAVEGSADVLPETSTDGLIRPGSTLRFGELGVEWTDIGRFTRITGTLDASAFEDVAVNVGLVPQLASLQAALGAGTAISVGSTIGVGTSGPPEVNLVPSYTRSLLVAERDGVREFSPEAGSNVLAFLGDAVDYLSSPSKSDASPVNRYERMIDDMGGSLSEMRAAVSSARKLADTLGSVADDGGDQLAGRLVLGTRQLGVIENALTNIDSILTTVEGSVNVDSDEPLLLGLLFDDDQAESLDRTITNVRELSDELRDGERTVFSRIAGDRHGQRFDSIMVQTERLTDRANEMLAGLESSGGSAVTGAKVYGVVTALAQALSTIAVLGIWR